MFPGIAEDAPAVQVHKSVQERQEQIDEPLISEHVDIERVIKNQPVDGPLPVREEGDTIIVPLVKQILRIEKEWVLTEEIHLIRRREERPAGETVSLQEEKAELFDCNGARIVDPKDRRGVLGGRLPVFKGKLES